MRCYDDMLVDRHATDYTQTYKFIFKEMRIGLCSFIERQTRCSAINIFYLSAKLVNVFPGFSTAEKISHYVNFEFRVIQKMYFLDNFRKQYMHLLDL